jgi:hypothetical protein
MFKPPSHWMEVYELPNWQFIILWEVIMGEKICTRTLSSMITSEFYNYVLFCVEIFDLLLPLD